MNFDDMIAPRVKTDINAVANAIIVAGLTGFTTQQVLDGAIEREMEDRYTARTGDREAAIAQVALMETSAVQVAYLEAVAAENEGN